MKKLSAYYFSSCSSLLLDSKDSSYSSSTPAVPKRLVQSGRSGSTTSLVVLGYTRNKSKVLCRDLTKRQSSSTVLSRNLTVLSGAGSLKYHHRLSEDNTCVLPTLPTKFSPGESKELGSGVAEEPEKKPPLSDQQSSSFPTSITFVVVEEPDMSEEKLPLPPQSPSSPQGNN